MADYKKEQEREELHRAIWAIADELRGSVDGWDFKNYVLGTMFYRYISENLANYINEGEQAAGNADFDYAKMPDAEAEEARDGLIEEKGFFILPSELFCNVRARAPHDDNLNETLERVFNHIEDSAKGSESENSFAGLFDDFDAMIKETKVGTILNGVRGEEPKAVGPLAETLKKVQRLVLEIPEIKSIDGNPVLVTKDRAVVVDFKMLLK